MQFCDDCWFFLLPLIISIDNNENISSNNNCNKFHSKVTTNLSTIPKACHPKRRRRKQQPRKRRKSHKQTKVLKIVRFVLLVCHFVFSCHFLRVLLLFVIAFARILLYPLFDFHYSFSILDSKINWCVVGSSFCFSSFLGHYTVIQCCCCASCCGQLIVYYRILPMCLNL